jgi:signal transduction histidine kinase
MTAPSARHRTINVPLGTSDRAHRYGVISLAATAVVLLILAARPELVPTAAALLFAAVMVGVAMGILILCEGRQRALVSLQESQARLAFLVEAGEVLSSTLDYQATLMSLARLTVPYLADWCAIDMVEDDDSFSRLAVVHRDPAKADAARELQQRYPPEPGGAHGLPRVLRTGRPEFVPAIEESALEVRDDGHRRLIGALGLTSYMCVPLVARGRTLGAISFAYATGARRYHRDDLALAEAVARRAGLAVDNARLFRDAETASRAKDEFLATLSHELRTPLHAMLGWTRMLRTRTLDEPTTARALETLERNTKLQAQLIEDLLDVSRIITGRMRIDVHPVDLAPVVDAALDSVRAAADAKGVRLEARADPGVGPVSGDADRLQQVVWNLLSNAIKFTPRDGRVRVGVDVADGHARVRVMDTGQGIDADFLPHMFERFRQSDGLGARTLGGLGLGLAIVRHIVELHGGTVRADSAGEGRGATFTVALPLAKPA